MKQTLWIYSARNQWFTNGKYTITVDVSHRYPFRTIQDIYYGDTDLYLHREDLEIGSHREVAQRLAPPWQPYTPEELIAILDSK